MSESLLRELAERIAREQFLSQWPIYLLMLALAFVGGALASYFGSYFKKRGEALATKSDFEDMLVQLKATTTATEDVKSKISYTDWATKERKILLRTKLEELLQKLHELADWQDTKRFTYLYTNDSINSLSSPLPQASLLVVLYFPELRIEVSEYLNLHRKIMILLSNAKTELLKVNTNSEATSKIQQDSLEIYIDQYTVQYYALYSIENRCYSIMNELINI